MIATRGRRAVSRRVLLVLAALAISAPVLAPVASAAVVTPSVVTPSVATASPLSDATSATREARLLRQQTVAMLGRYLADYGDRFTTEENDQLRAYRSTADRQLAGVVVTTRRLQAAVAAGVPRREILAAGRAAQRSHQRARAAAQASYEGARRIMEPQLSLFEGISAIRDYDAMLGRFDDLGDRIDAVVATVD
jgi:hypothetical protein